MIDTSNLPLWLAHATQYYYQVFNLHEWSVGVTLERILKNDAQGTCQVYQSTNQAAIVLRSDIQDTRLWHYVIIHELMHVKLGRLDEWLEHVIFADYKNPIALPTYVGFLESYVDAMSVILCDLLYPQWQQVFEHDQETASTAILKDDDHAVTDIL